LNSDSPSTRTANRQWYCDAAEQIADRQRIGGRQQRAGEQGSDPRKTCRVADAVIDQGGGRQCGQQHQRNREEQDGQHVAPQLPHVDFERSIEYQQRQEHVEDQVMKASWRMPVSQPRDTSNSDPTKPVSTSTAGSGSR
jgi:hypothetical protein